MFYIYITIEQLTNKSQVLSEKTKNAQAYITVNLNI